MINYLNEWTDFENLVAHFGTQNESEIKMTCRFLLENGKIIENEWGKLRAKKRDQDENLVPL